MIESMELTEALTAIGTGAVFVGNPKVAGGMSHLGYIKGRVGWSPKYLNNDLKAEELTGNVPHQRSVKLDSVEVSVPLVLGDPALLLSLNPVAPQPAGTFGGGWSKPQPARETTVLLIPIAEIGDGMSYDGAVWTPAAPKHAIWLWRAFRTPGDTGFADENGGESPITLTFTGAFAGSYPEGHKVFTVGNPVLAGVTDLRL
jgi:hypothetical protein